MAFPAAALHGVEPPSRLTPLELHGWSELPSFQAARTMAAWQAFVSAAEAQALPAALLRLLWAARTHTAYARSVHLRRAASRAPATPTLMRRCPFARLRYCH